MRKNIKTYSELISLPTFQERFEYLQLTSTVADTTFGGHRYLNQKLYSFPEWKRIRRQVIIRDGGFDLAHEDYPITGGIYVHHINPITIDDIIERRKNIFDLNNLISASFDTHNAIHYGNIETIKKYFVVERKKNDTCPWRR